jgi:alpha-methylacyl-CoA racemase
MPDSTPPSSAPAARSDSHGAAAGPLAGARVVEFAGKGPGPFAAMMLADMGATVVRIERTQDVGAPARDLVARSRQSIAIDLKHADGRDVAMQLVRQADVLIEGFRPGVMERLGLSPEACIAVNRGLIYGRMSGWGQTGPWAARAGHDINYIALKSFGNCRFDSVEG